MKRVTSLAIPSIYLSIYTYTNQVLFKSSHVNQKDTTVDQLNRFILTIDSTI